MLFRTATPPYNDFFFYLTYFMSKLYITGVAKWSVAFLYNKAKQMFDIKYSFLIYFVVKNSSLIIYVQCSAVYTFLKIIIEILITLSFSFLLF